MGISPQELAQGLDISRHIVHNIIREGEYMGRWKIENQVGNVWHGQHRIALFRMKGTQLFS